jgi:hypothetical protein
MRRGTLEGPTIKAALFLGFGLTFGLWFFAGYQFTRRMADVEREAAAINGRYMNAQELLSTVRAQILMGSVYVHDALLDPSPESLDSYRQGLRDTYRAIDRAHAPRRLQARTPGFLERRVREGAVGRPRR